ncbi:MAG: hypothetical protein WCJ37_18095 [Syntrophus sp. (in: bacteria)]
MNAPITKKPDNKGKAKPVTTKPIATKPGADQEKAINQLRQEIRTLAKAVIDMQQKPETQAIIVEIPKELFIRLNPILIDFEQCTGRTMSISEYIIGAVESCLYSDEDALRREAEEKLAEMEKNKQEKIPE